MQLSVVKCVLVLAMICLLTEAVKNKKLFDIINVCKRNDVEISKCMCINFNNVVPKLKDSAPEMNIIPLDPAYLPYIKMDFTPSQGLKLTGNLRNLEIYGLNECRAQECGAWITSDGIQQYYNLFFPRLTFKSLYRGMGKFLLLGIDTSGDFSGEFTELNLQIIWNSTVYMKNNKEYLHYTGNVIDLTVGKIVVYFSNILGNHTELNEEINQAINENIQMLYKDVKPIIFDTFVRISEKIVNDFYATFPYDQLFP